MAEREYDVAQICLDDHVVNAASRRLPVHNAAFCSVCWVATTTRCEREQCKKAIRGLYWGPDSKGIYEKPSYCHGCGWPYPWTRTALVTARALAAELDALEPGDRDTLAQSLDDLAKDSPRTMLAAVRFKKLVAKAGPEAAGAFRRILIDVVMKAAKDYIWPGM